MTFKDAEGILDALLTGSISVFNERELEAGSPNYATGFLKIMEIENRRIGGNDTFPIIQYTLDCTLEGDPNIETTLRALLNTLSQKFNNNNRNTNSNVKYYVNVLSELNIDNGWIELEVIIIDRYTEAATS